MTEIHTSPEVITSSSELRKFVTRIWQHPLLTDKTRLKRQEALEAIHRYSGNAGILLIPVGSNIWISGDKSDVDFILLYKEDKEQETQDISDYLNANRGNVDPSKPRLHAAGKHKLRDKFNFEADMSVLALLFLTPDEYITGDKEWLKELRKNSLSLQNYDGTQTDYISTNFESQFPDRIYLELRQIKEWPKKAFAVEGGSYFPRFMNALFDRASKTRNPKKYAELFYRNLTELRPPDFKTIRQEIQTSDGEIHLDQRFIAQGL